MEITLLLNSPPGGRCRLYRAYATALSEHAGAVCIESFDGLPSQPELCAPAILVDGQRVAPSDGVILSPEDLGAALSRVYPEAPQLQAILEQVLEGYLQEWS